MSTGSNIVQAASINGFFEEAVSNVMRQRQVVASGTATHYLVSLLTDFAKPDEDTERTLDRPLTLLLDEALQTPNLGERFERLRTLGDGVLYGCGFFGDHFEARGVEQSYLVGIGTRAYGSARSLIATGSSSDLSAVSEEVDVFGELAAKFASFVEVLRELGDKWLALGTHSSKGVLKLYERWLKTGSESLKGVLQTHGFQTTTPSKILQ
jgi:hypothetical protein